MTTTYLHIAVNMLKDVIVQNIKIDDDAKITFCEWNLTADQPILNNFQK